MSKYIAEFIGTFGLVFCGTGAIVIDQVSNGTVGHLGIAITFGLIVMAMIYAVGEASGAHLNPAVSLAFVVAGKFPLRELLPYTIAQTTGALLASGVLYLLFPDATSLGETLPAGSASQTFVLEVILTFLLMFVIINVATGSKEVGTMAGMAIGATVLLEALFAGPITGASMNPARSLAPALLSGNTQYLLLYLSAPPLGAVLSIWAWRAIQAAKDTAVVEEG